MTVLEKDSCYESGPNGQKCEWKSVKQDTTPVNDTTNTTAPVDDTNSTNPVNDTNSTDPTTNPSPQILVCLSKDASS
jgi:hypothetical protein